MTIFSYDDYKKWVNDLIASLPNRGRGQSMRIAEHLNTSPTIVTQVFRGDRDLTPEQAVLLCEYFALSKIESKYLILLVNLSRAGSHRYKALLREELEDLRQQARHINNRVAKDIELTDEAKSILYSNWFYLAAWSLVAIGGFDSAPAIADRLGISVKKAAEALEFLKRFGLVKDDEKGRLSVGPTLIHLDADSPHIARHHQNWRLRAFRKYDSPGENDAFYTAPVTLSSKDAKLVRERVLQFIAETVKTIAPSPSEELFCLCLDWFGV